MVNSYTRRNKKSTCPCEVSDLEETARKAAAVHGNVPDNSSKVPNMDPLYRLTTIFTNNFDAVGREHARELSEGNKTEKREFPHAEKQTQEKQATEVELRKRHDSPEYVHSTAELNAGCFTDRFSAYASISSFLLILLPFPAASLILAVCCSVSACFATTL